MVPPWGVSRPIALVFSGASQSRLRRETRPRLAPPAASAIAGQMTSFRSPSQAPESRLESACHRHHSGRATDRPRGTLIGPVTRVPKAAPGGPKIGRSQVRVADALVPPIPRRPASCLQE